MAGRKKEARVRFLKKANGNFVRSESKVVGGERIEKRREEEGGEGVEGLRERLVERVRKEGSER